MKGLELPINMIIIIAIAVLVLVVIAAFFTGQIGGGISTVGLEAAFSDGCQQLRSAYGCSMSGSPFSSITVNYQRPGSNTPTSTLAELCTVKNLQTTIANDPTSCGKACGCVSVV